MKKFTRTLIFILVMIFCLSSFTACKQNLWNPYITIESSDEYFIYHVLEPKKIFGYGETECYIVGLTEKGKEQTCLVVPEYYEEHVINGIGYQEMTYLIGAGYHGNFTSENLEKLYIPKNFKRIYDQRYEVYSLYDTYVVYWDSDSYGHRLDAKIKGKIYGYNYYLKRIYPSLSYIDEPIKIANVSYLYNYGEVQNDGYYWVDSYDESLISFVPPNPEREGYTFGGWYKESECINKWNFETDITGKEIVMEENKVYDTYDGICLYAKWIKN